MNKYKKILLNLYLTIPANQKIEIPESLTEPKSRELYQKTAAKLKSLGILNYLDLPRIEIMCIYYQRIQAIDQELKNPDCEHRAKLLKRYRTLTAQYNRLALDFQI